MASHKEYLDFILDQLSGLEGVTHRAMMGEFLLYFNGKVVGGIYDDRLLLKPTPGALAKLPEAKYELPYPGAKPMLLIEDVDNRALLKELVETVRADLR